MDLPENPEFPPIVADAFVAYLKQYGYTLDYHIDTLFSELETIFEYEQLLGCKFTVSYNGGDKEHEFRNGLASYLGETFVREYGGHWIGHFSVSVGANYYTSSVRFGEFTFLPFAYVGYRLSNGVKDTGDLKMLVERNAKSMRDGVNYKRREIDDIIKQGTIAIDNEPWS